MDKNEYSWLVVAYPSPAVETTLLKSDCWYISKLQAMEKLKRAVFTRGVDIPNRWGGPEYFVIRRSKVNL